MQPKEFEKVAYFESCIPIEVMAERGRQTMQFGPLKPVGLEDPENRPAPLCGRAIADRNVHGTCYNMVGFQTKLTYPEQKQSFGAIPGRNRPSFCGLAACIATPSSTPRSCCATRSS